MCLVHVEFGRWLVAVTNSPCINDIRKYPFHHWNIWISHPEEGKQRHRGNEYRPLMVEIQSVLLTLVFSMSLIRS